MKRRSSAAISAAVRKRCSGRRELLGDGDGILGDDARGAAFAFVQTNTAAVFEIDGGDDEHARPDQRFSSSLHSTVALD